MVFLECLNYLVGFLLPEIGHTIKLRPLNYETVQDVESAAIRDCFR